MKPLRIPSHPAPPVPHTVSGVIDCPAELSWRELVEAALRNGWSVDGLQPEAADATVGALLGRRQPRPIVWGCGLLPERCCRIVTTRSAEGDYTSIRAPRKASGPDWAYLFVGAEGAHGRVVEASFGLVRPASAYLLFEADYATPEALFDATRQLARLAPFSTRRLDWRGRHLAAAVPAHAGVAGALRERLVGLGGRLERTTGVPESFLLAPAVEHDGPTLVVSGAFDRVADTIARVEGAGGDGPVTADLRYPGTHGLEATIGVEPGQAARLEAAWTSLLEGGFDLHDARRRGESANWEWLATTVDLEGTAS